MNKQHSSLGLLEWEHKRCFAEPVERKPLEMADKQTDKIADSLGKIAGKFADKLVAEIHRYNNL